VFSDLLGARADIEEAGRLLDSVDGVDKTVHSQYYAVAADYYKVSSSTQTTFKDQ
jgi:26S proteasome regulatory subunit N9